MLRAFAEWLHLRCPRTGQWYLKLPCRETKQRDVAAILSVILACCRRISRRIRQIELVVNAQRKVVGWNPMCWQKG